MSNEKPTPREEVTNPRIGVQRLGSGWAAIHFVDVEQFDIYGYSIGKHTDIHQTGLGRWRTERQAVEEAKQWSETDKIPLMPGLRTEPEPVKIGYDIAEKGALQGLTVKRAGWKDVAITSRKQIVPTGRKDRTLIMVNEDGIELQHYRPTKADLSATDWEIAEWPTE